MLSEVNIEAIFSYELITKNPIWRFGLVVVGIEFAFPTQTLYVKNDDKDKEAAV